MIKKLLFVSALIFAAFPDANAQCVATITGNNVACYGDTSVLQATPGGVSYQWYAWGQAIPGATSSQYIASNTENLTVVIDFGSCIDTSAIFAHTGDPIFYVVSGTNTTFCDGDSIGLYAGPAGGTPPYFSICQGPAGYVSSFQNIIIPVAQVANAGNYVMTITDGVGCIAQDTIVITVDSTAPPSVTNPLYCINEVANLTALGSNLLWYPTQVGGTGTSSMTANTSVPGITTVFVSQTLNGCESERAALAYTVITCDSVWPGDVNYDLTADNNDVLDLALAYGQTGPSRTGATNNWVAQYMADWGTNQTSGPDLKHADCNGDGLVDLSDTVAISQNYGQVHLKGGHFHHAKSAADPDLYFDLTGISFVAGTTVNIPIKLGTMALPMSNILGLAADIVVDNISLNDAPVISAVGSWLGNSTNSISFTKGVGTNQADWTLARTDHNNVSGNGTIGILTMNIPLSSGGQDAILYFSDVKIIDNAGNVISNYNIVDDTATIIPVTVRGATTVTQYAVLAPNPSGNEASLLLALPTATDVFITVTDVTGRQVWSCMHKGVAGSQSVSLPASELAAGIYNLQLKDTKGVALQNLKWLRN